ncbi:hypothetical protein ASC97_19150 [Rhizobium sp. Root1203]|uniref:YegP family protein n=1 Tax=Rhizobium sp. Root1203 TaxID=1736427 RepID=UPI00070DDE72|nr:DUF1508 domain-containing protein [Rhizobium sp. Root1203]KQV31798.1 hypothetical protein ASC97_19150 [Rhizobium sp. Root1203]
MASCVASNGDTWEIYSGSDGWRWRRTASNGRIVGASSQGYSNRGDCVDNAARNGMTCNPV